MLLGAHQSVAGGAYHAVQRGRDDGCEAIQIFARPSAQWRSTPLVTEEVSMFRSEHAAVGWPVLSHASYLINISAVDPVILKKSRDALEEEMTRAEELGLQYVVLHPGAHLGCGEEGGAAAAAASLSELYDRTRGMAVKLLLEITAGQGSCLGCRFEQVEAMLSQTRGGHTMGVCFDTCHAHAAGYDLSTEEGYDKTFAAFDRILGLDRLLAFHLNDSKTPAGSRVDRHEEIGDGYLGLLPFWRLVNDRRFDERPAVLETPPGPDKLPSFKRNLQRLRALIGAPRPFGPPKAQALPEKRDPRQGRLFAERL
ncbi:MAG: deoxyribonuclease IV [Myxococcales bacterium]